MIRKIVMVKQMSVNDPEILQQLKEKYHERSHPLPDSVACGDALPSMSGRIEQLTSLKDGTAQ